MENNNELLKIRDLTNYLSVSKSTVYKLMETEDFPKPIKLTGKKLGTNWWVKSDVVTWLKGRRHAG